MVENYELQLKDFIPYVGFKRYKARTGRPTAENIRSFREIDRRKFSLVVLNNIIYFPAAIGGLFIGLESLLK